MALYTISQDGKDTFFANLSTSVAQRNGYVGCI